MVKLSDVLESTCNTALNVIVNLTNSIWQLNKERKFDLLVTLSLLHVLPVIRLFNALMSIYVGTHSHCVAIPYLLINHLLLYCSHIISTWVTGSCYADIETCSFQRQFHFFHNRPQPDNSASTTYFNQVFTHRYITTIRITVSSHYNSTPYCCLNDWFKSSIMCSPCEGSCSLTPLRWFYRI